MSEFIETASHRERDRKRKTETETQRQRDREGALLNMAHELPVSDII